MNENIDLTKILKDCPKGTKLYSSLFGEVEFQQVELGFIYPIVIKLKEELIGRLTSNGKLFNHYDSECILFPSKDQRDWSKFTAPWCKKEKFNSKTLKPFDKVIARCSDFKWVCDMFSNYDKSKCVMPYVCVGGFYEVCVPYNDNTKHLIGTKEEAPDFYKYWEE